jgi:hypothetical protein
MADLREANNKKFFENLFFTRLREAFANFVSALRLESIFAMAKQEAELDVLTESGAHTVMPVVASNSKPDRARDSDADKKAKEQAKFTIKLAAADARVERAEQRLQAAEVAYDVAAQQDSEACAKEMVAQVPTATVHETRHAVGQGFREARMAVRRGRAQEAAASEGLTVFEAVFGQNFYAEQAALLKIYEIFLRFARGRLANANELFAAAAELQAAKEARQTLLAHARNSGLTLEVHNHPAPSAGAYLRDPFGSRTVPTPGAAPSAPELEQQPAGNRYKFTQPSAPSLRSMLEGDNSTPAPRYTNRQ